MKGMEPSMTKEVRAKARSASRSRRERSAQTRGELRGRVGRLAWGGDLSVLQGPKEREESEALNQ
jgi:hypothetical protein